MPSRIEFAPPLLGVTIGIVSWTINYRRADATQANGWLLWSVICTVVAAFDIVKAFGPLSKGPFAAVAMTLNVLMFMFGWPFLLLNWMTAPKAQSWLVCH